jgi:DNA-nicking Smr family endonuclease
MKKKSPKTEQKAKEFAVRPFSALKGVPVVPPVSPVQPPPPVRQPAGDVEPDDFVLFLRQMEGVARIHVRDELLPRKEERAARSEQSRNEAARQSRQREEEDRQLFDQAVAQLKLDVTFTDEIPDEGDPLRPVPVNRMRQLKRGAIRIDLELDLHGLGREEALEYLGRFITGAFQRGQGAVLVITGKGNNSPGEPVLQRAVVGWLREQGKGMVAEFNPAPRDMGGSGALVVFLRSSAKDSP